MGEKEDIQRSLTIHRLMLSLVIEKTLEYIDGMSSQKRLEMLTLLGPAHSCLVGGHLMTIASSMLENAIAAEALQCAFKDIDTALREKGSEDG